MNGTVDAAAMSLAGVTASDDDVKLTADGNLTFEGAVNLAEGDLFLDVNGDLSQLAVGTIETAGLGLMVDGTIVLNEANDVDVLAIDSQGAAQFNDVNNIMVGSVSIEAVSANRAMFAMNGTVDAAAMSLAGISTASSLSLVADGNIFQDQPVVVGGDAVLDLSLIHI